MSFVQEGEGGVNVNTQVAKVSAPAEAGLIERGLLAATQEAREEMLKRNAQARVEAVATLALLQALQGR